MFYCTYRKPCVNYRRLFLAFVADIKVFASLFLASYFEKGTEEAGRLEYSTDGALIESVDCICLIHGFGAPSTGSELVLGLVHRADSPGRAHCACAAVVVGPTLHSAAHPRTDQWGTCYLPRYAGEFTLFNQR